jgi:hypothetical protein
MPLSPLGIFHTVLGIGAIISVIVVLVRDKQIGTSGYANWFYLIATLLTGASALGIFRHGGFHVAHLLGIVTILAVVVGLIASKVSFLGWFQKYFVALCFSSTILFHALPTATEILTRFPMDAPIVDSLTHPFLQKVFLGILIVWIIGFTLQVLWIKKHNNSESAA